MAGVPWSNLLRLYSCEIISCWKSSVHIKNLQSVQKASLSSTELHPKALQWLLLTSSSWIPHQTIQSSSSNVCKNQWEHWKRNQRTESTHSVKKAPNQQKSYSSIQDLACCAATAGTYKGKGKGLSDQHKVDLCIKKTFHNYKKYFPDIHIPFSVETGSRTSP